jgi:hypothetical protein
MKDVLGILHGLNRPRLLVRAARKGAADYCRNRHLQRILGYGNMPRSAEAMMRLMDIERELDMLRRREDAAYSLPRHIDVLIALVGEARLLGAALAPDAVSGVAG